MDTRKFAFMLLLALVVVFFMTSVLAVRPFGADITSDTNETAPADTAESHNAIAGNVTLLAITAYSRTQSWQGYYGNVTGTIFLADSGDNVFYNWSLTTPEGEVYATENNSLNWAYIQCLNFTAAGTYASDTAQNGSTSLYGKNLTQLEADFGIAANDQDGVNETFSLTGNHPAGESLTHDEFFTNNLQFTAGECLSSHIFSNSKSAEDGMFQEVLLYEPSTQAVVFTALLDEEAVYGFDGGDYDFEMLVLEDGHGTDTDTTTYYFYIEIE